MIRTMKNMRGMQAKMLCRFPRRLVLEAPPEEADEVAALVKSAMEGGGSWKCRSWWDIGSGENWRDAK